MLVPLFLLFLSLSFMALGGGTAVVPEMHRQAVSHYHWLTDRQFVDLYAITQISPPSMLVVCLVGYAAWGWPGMAAASLGMFGPSCVLAFYVRRVWARLEASRWGAALKSALGPVGVGLFFSGALVIAQGADRTPGAVLLTIAVACLMGFTRVSSLPLMLGAGLLGWLGWV